MSEVEGYIVVTRAAYEAANLADRSGVRTEILGYGLDQADALRDASDRVLGLAEAGCAFELVILEATGEVVDAWEKTISTSILWYCRTGMARLGEGTKP